MTATPAPRTSRLTAWTTLARAETRLFARDPLPMMAGLAQPTVVVAVLGSIPALGEPSATFGGLRFLTYFAPSLLAVGVAWLGLQTLPTTLAAYREKGVLRRLSVTPMRPSALLLVQLLINLGTALVATLAMVTVAVLAFDVPAPRHPLAFAGAFLLGALAVFAIGLVIAAVATGVRAATGIGIMAFSLTLFGAGIYLPKFLLSDALVRIGELVPPGTGALQGAWFGEGVTATQLAAMAAVALVATGVAARLFRWE